MLKPLKRKKITMGDIANKLNISINAVSLALNDKAGVSDNTRNLIVETASKMGYFNENPDYINRKSTKNICMLIQDKFFRDVPFYSKVIFGIEKEAKYNGYDIIVNLMNKEKYDIPLCIKNRKVSGILLVGNIPDDYLEKINEFNIPIVMVDCASNVINTDAVLSQNISGSYKAVRYLMKNGHKEIGFFGDINSSLSFKERWLGYYECMSESKVYSEGTLSKILDFSVINPMMENYILRNNFDEIKKILSKIKKMPSAWMCCNDMHAICLKNALESMGYRIPEDISIIGFDDIDLCTMVTPELTTIYVNKELMGKTAVRRLLWRIDNINAPFEKISMAVSLVERNSVKAV